MSDQEKLRKKRGPAPQKTIEQLKQDLERHLLRRNVLRLERLLEHAKALERGENRNIREPDEEEQECMRRIRNIRGQIYDRS